MSTVTKKNPDRLTWKQIQERYPHQWVGITNIETLPGNNATVLSAEVIYTDKDKFELSQIQFETDGKVWGIYTTPDDSLQISSVRW